MCCSSQTRRKHLVTLPGQGTDNTNSDHRNQESLNNHHHRYSQDAFFYGSLNSKRKRLANLVMWHNQRSEQTRFNSSRCCTLGKHEHLC